MRILSASIVIGPLILIGALPAAAGQAPVALDPGAPVRLAAGDSTADRNSTLKRRSTKCGNGNESCMTSARKRRPSGKESGNAAENDLNEAWTKAEAASRQLQTVGAEGAQTSFEKASHELAEAWHEIHPDDK